MQTTNADPRQALGIELGRHARLLHVVRARMAAHAPRDLDFAALTLLLTVVRCGPKRQGELAESALLDPSTTSRYVRQLVSAGLVSREADPDDGRAVRLVPTETGQQVAHDLFSARDALIGDVLRDWPEQDITHFTTLLSRLNDELDTLRPHLREAESLNRPSKD